MQALLDLVTGWRSKLYMYRRVQTILMGFALMKIL